VVKFSWSDLVGFGRIWSDLMCGDSRSFLSPQSNESPRAAVKPVKIGGLMRPYAALSGPGHGGGGVEGWSDSVQGNQVGGVH